MTATRLSPRKFVVFTFVPVIALLLTAEVAVRVRFFVAHGEWSYLTAPFGRFKSADAPDQFVAKPVSIDVPAAPAPARASAPAPSEPVHAGGSAPPASVERGDSAGSEPVRRGDTAPPPGPVQGGPAVAAPAGPIRSTPGAAPVDAVPVDAAPAPAASAPAAVAPPAAPPQQMVFKWQKPCADETVFSTELQKAMPRTWSDNCFRGDRVEPRKGTDEYRVVFLGGSTVEDAQSDEEMMTAQFKRALTATPAGKRLTVVNAGRAGFDSNRIYLYWASTIESYSPDLVLYYEAWNEQPTDAKWTQVDDRIGTWARHRVHETLYYKSMLYTYLAEKFAFLTASDDHFWKIDVPLLRTGFTKVATAVKTARGPRLMFVTQVVQFPRIWKGVDTFDYKAVDALIDRLRGDKAYVYDVVEISALNQRLAVGYTIELCQRLDVPVIDIRHAVEELGESGRREMFMDLGHLTVKGDRIVGTLIAQHLNRAG